MVSKLFDFTLIRNGDKLLINLDNLQYKPGSMEHPFHVPWEYSGRC